MNLAELKRRRGEILARLDALSKQTTLTNDEYSEQGTLLNEYNDIGPKIIQMESANAAALQMAQSAGRVAGSEALAGRTGEQPGAVALTDEEKRKERLARRPVGERFASDQIVRTYLERGAAGKSERFNVGSLHPEYTAGGSYSVDGGPSERYDLVTTGSPTYLVPPQVVPGIFRPRDYALTMRQVLSSGRTTSDTIYFLRELLYTNAAAAVAQASATTGSSGLKPESALTFEQASAPVVTIAHWIPMTRQALDDAAQLRSYVENRLQVGLDRLENSTILNGDGSGANMRGILNTSGIQVLDDTYFAGAAVKNAGTQNENFERILRAKTKTRITGRAQATFVTLNPVDLEQFMTITDSTRQYMGGGPFSNGDVRTIWGLPIAEDEAITAGTALVGDGTMATVWDRYAAALMLMDTINDQFVRNMFTLLAEDRLALTVFRPAAFVNVTLKAW